MFLLSIGRISWGSHPGLDCCSYNDFFFSLDSTLMLVVYSHFPFLPESALMSCIFLGICSFYLSLQDFWSSSILWVSCCLTYAPKTQLQITATVLFCLCLHGSGICGACVDGLSVLCSDGNLSWACPNIWRLAMCQGPSFRLMPGFIGS